MQPRPQNPSVCPKCGEVFDCAGGTEAMRCWCAALPHVMPCCGTADAACFCPSCLHEAIGACKDSECASS
jgi:hypothetical protein